MTADKHPCGSAREQKEKNPVKELSNSHIVVQRNATEKENKQQWDSCQRNKYSFSISTASSSLYSFDVSQSDVEQHKSRSGGKLKTPLTAALAAVPNIKRPEINLENSTSSFIYVKEKDESERVLGGKLGRKKHGGGYEGKAKADAGAGLSGLGVLAAEKAGSKPADVVSLGECPGRQPLPEAVFEKKVLIDGVHLSPSSAYLSSLLTLGKSALPSQTAQCGGVGGCAAGETRGKLHANVYNTGSDAAAPGECRKEVQSAKAKAKGGKEDIGAVQNVNLLPQQLHREEEPQRRHEEEGGHEKVVKDGGHGTAVCAMGTGAGLFVPSQGPFFGDGVMPTTIHKTTSSEYSPMDQSMESLHADQSEDTFEEETESRRRYAKPPFASCCVDRSDPDGWRFNRPRRHGFQLPLHSLQMTALSLTTLSTVLFLASVVPAYFFLYFDGYLGVWMPVFFILITLAGIAIFFTWVLWLFLSFRENGDFLNQGELCSFCQRLTLETSRHCKACNKCISGFDHHCKWLNMCIGSRNYFMFICFLTSALSSTGVALICSIVLLAKWWVPLKTYSLFFCIGPILLSSFTIVAFPPLAQLLGFHVRLRWLGLTTFEYITFQRREAQSAQNEPPADADK